MGRPQSKGAPHARYHLQDIAKCSIKKKDQ